MSATIEEIVEGVNDDATLLRAKVHSNTETIAMKMRSMFGDRHKMLSSLVRMYKFMFTEDENLKEIWEKNNSDIQNDLNNTQYIINDAISHARKELEMVEKTQQLFQRRIDMISPFLDLCYIYFIHHFDVNAPFYRLPTTILKHKLIANTLKSNTLPLHVETNRIFEKIIKDSQLTEIRQEIPPYYLRMDITIDELRVQLKEKIKPIFKELLTCLLKLEPSSKTVIEMHDNTTTQRFVDIPTELQREDNL